MSEKRTWRGWAWELGDSAITGGAKGACFLSGALGAAGVVTGYMAMRKQISENVPTGETAGVITREQAFDLGWSKIGLLSDRHQTYQGTEMHGTELVGAHIDGSELFLAGELGLIVSGVVFLCLRVKESNKK